MNPIDPWIDSAEVRKLAESLLQPVPSAREAGAEAGYGDSFVGFANVGGGGAGPVEAPVATQTALQAEPDPGSAPTEPTRREPAVHPAREQCTPDASPSDPPALEQQAREALANARRRAEHGGLLSGLPASPEPTPEWADDPPPTGPREEDAGPEESEVVDEEPAEIQPVRPGPDPSSGPAVPPPLPPEAHQPEPRRATGGSMMERLRAYRDWLHESVQAEAFFVADRDGHLLFDEIRSPKLLQVSRTLAHASHAANRQAGATAVGSLHVKLANNRILEVLPVICSYGPLVLGIVVPAVLTTSAVEVVSRGLQQVVDGPSD